ncbi:MAG: SpoIIE family protein phosphatase [Coriobacteriia bacterium]|nr:SpoIIE family protein phosphatase [Coriobacteriia bacterium]
MRGYGLRRKLVLLVAVVAVPLIAFVGYQLAHLYDDLTEQALLTTERNARVGSAGFNRFVHQMAEQGQAVGLAVLGGRLTPQESEEYLRSLGQHAPLSEFTVSDIDGEVVATTFPPEAAEEVASLPEFERVRRGEPFAITALRDIDGRAGLLVLAPVGSPVRGFVAVALDAADIGGIVRTETPGGVVIVTDPEGRLAYSNAPASAALEAGRPLGPEVPTVRAALEGRVGAARRIGLPGLPSPYIGSHVPVPEIGWTVGFYRLRGQALRHVTGEIAQALAIVAAILLIAAAAGWRVSSGILWPLSRLTSAAERLSAGDFDTEVAVRTDDEIGVLAEGFRDMQGSLRRTFASVREVAQAGGRLNEATLVDEVALAGARHLVRLLHAGAGVVTLFAHDPALHGVGTDDVEGLSSEARSRVPDTALAESGYRLTMLDPRDERYPYGRFLVSLALSAERQAIGRADVVVAPRHAEPQFVRGDVELAVGLAQQIAVALANAGRFELESEIAGTLQDALLTQPFPIPRTEVGLAYRPATQGTRVGGDFYDFIRVDEVRFVLVLGDISGHGLEAARHMTAAKGALRSFAVEDPSPGRVLDRANVVIGEQLEPGRFVTVFLTLLDTETGEVRTANAGHPPPFVLTAPEGRQSVLPVGGPPLGVVPGFEYEESTVRLRDGDWVVAFSDGLTEARGPYGALFGEEGVAALLERTWPTSPSELADALALAAEEFAGGRLTDDLAVLVFRRIAGEAAAG